MLCGDLSWVGWGGREVQEGGDVCIHIADSLHCTAETNNIVKQFYSNFFLNIYIYVYKLRHSFLTHGSKETL